MNFSNPFTFKGRIGRTHFGIAYLGLIFAPPALFLNLFRFRGLLGESWPIFIQVALLVGSVAIFVYSLSLIVRRAHDVGYSTTEAIIWLIIPIANLIFMFRLFFSPADAITSDKNQEGVDISGDINYTSFDELSQKAQNHDRGK